MSQFDYKESYQRNLPHIQPPDATFFVTCRLAGSLPQSVIAQWKKERQWLEYLEKANPAYHTLVRLNFERAWFAKFESLLDGGAFGPLWLGDDRVAATVAESLRYHDERVYRLKAYSIMRNHVHLVIKPLPISREDDAAYHSLSSIMQSLKGYTAFKCNRILDREGEFWAHESYDHYVRDAEEWRRIVNYVLNNPVKAGYVENWRDWKWNYRRSNEGE
jgi:REP element-mobilizing transposase RayT